LRNYEPVSDLTRPYYRDTLSEDSIDVRLTGIGHRTCENKGSTIGKTSGEEKLSPAPVPAIINPLAPEAIEALARCQSEPEERRKH